MPFNDIMVAVHGIGKQSRYSTVRSVATRLANSQALSGTGPVRPVARQPLGYFHSDVKNVTSVRLIDDAESLEDSDLKSVGFAEVFLADIPQQVADEGRTLEETKAWAATVVARAQALCERAKKDPSRNWIVPPDFSLAGEVLDEIIETVYVLENLTFLAEKAGLMKFDLRRVLEEYLGDVQLVTEFSYYRTDVVGRFHEAMRSINQQHPDARLHIVAHSEGTVVSFLGLLHAICGRNVLPADVARSRDAKIENPTEIPAWLKQVRGFMTIGSPLDKHLLLWRRLWGSFDPSLFSATEIKDASSLLAKIKKPSDGVSKYLFERFSTDASDLLSAPAPALEGIVGELNRIVQGPPESLYEAAMTGKVSPFAALLSPEAKDLLAKKPTGPGLVRLNRILLEDAYPLEIAKKKSLPPGQIRWRNYYDFGDPIGFKLDSTRLWLAKMGIKIFEFCGCKECRHDMGFARYLLPGAAHNEYWNDSDVFEHFISNVVKQPKTAKSDEPHAVRSKPPPRTKPLIACLSAVFPYLCSFFLLMVGVFVLFKAVYAYSHPNLEPLQKFVRFEELGVKPPDSVHGLGLFSTICGIAALIAGATLLGRFRRLAVGKSWIVAGFAALLIGCGFYAWLVPEEIRWEIGERFTYLRPFVGRWGPTIGILGVTAIAGMSGFLAMSSRFENADRRQRWLMRGMRPLILCGAVAIGLVILLQLFPRDITWLRVNETQAVSFSSNEVALIRSARLTRDELKQMMAAGSTNWMKTVKNVEPVLATASPIWPVVLAGAAFLYFWWLATLVFDLAFVWHRYIRRSTANDRLREWNPYDFSARWDRKKGEHCGKRQSQFTS